MERSDIYEFLDEHGFVKTGSYGTSTGFGFTETYTFSRDDICIDVCECDEEKTVMATFKKMISYEAKQQKLKKLCQKN